MLRDGLFFASGLFAGVAGLLALLRLPYWLHEHTRKEALKARGGERAPQRWLH